jgi:hypothetical protein
MTSNESSVEFKATMSGAGADSSSGGDDDDDLVEIYENVGRNLGSVPDDIPSTVTVRCCGQTHEAPSHSHHT